MTFYRSTTSVIDPDDTTTATALTAPAMVEVPSIAPNGTYDGLTNIDELININFDAGDYYYGACLSGEGTTPSCTSTTLVTVEPPAANVTLPNTAPTFDPVNVTANTATDVTITLASGLTNEGNIASSDTGVVVTFYRSTDMTIDTGDTEVATAVILSLDPDETTDTLPSSGSFLLNFAAGEYYYGACLSGIGTTPSCTLHATLVVQ